jgi:hypothetical protein
MACRGGIDEGEKQRLRKLTSLFNPPHDSTCPVCGRTVAAYLIGGEWALQQHDAPLRRKPKGTKQSAGKRCIKSGGVTARFRTRKERAKLNGRKRAYRKR